MITYHHVGGRSGTFPLPLKGVSFSEDIHLILYDADCDCVEQIQHVENGEFGQVTVLPYCIGEKTGTGTFNINFHPTTSSLYDFNQEFDNYTSVLNPIYGQYRLGDACRLVKNIPLTLLSLQDAVSEARIQEIDFLSLDIQGAEYDVLKGSKALIGKNCLGVQVEIEFAKMYDNQKTTFEINQLMEEMGFELIELSKFLRYAPNALPIGFRGSEQLLCAEATYIKKFSTVLKEKSVEKLYKWALFGLINKKMGLCLMALKELSTLKTNKDIENTHYIDLLKKIFALYEKQETCKLPCLSELFSQDMLSAYYQGVPNDSEKFDEENKNIQKHLKDKYMAQLTTVKSLATETETPIELLLKQSGLLEVATAIRKNRLQEATYFLNLFRN
jgi:FkbM family methyltransferase